ncbi:MAG: glycosyltransferase family 2 protein, partial [Verrucomicrobia bacterium]|nr:glycosyltransferase family 2 protein [Verrucomicrobiota bacterium]
MSEDSHKKLLIFIVAYNAERTIASVLKRIPVKDLPAGTEVLVIDDSSADKTFEKALENRAVVEGLKTTVLCTPMNQG